MCSMKQFPGTIQKYLTKREHNRLFWLVSESSDCEKSDRDICLIYLSDGERDLHIVENFITDKRALPLPLYILPGMRDNAVNPKHGIYCHGHNVKYLESIWKFHADDQFVIAMASRTITE